MESVRQRIASACQRCGRRPSDVTLIGVAKGVAPELIQEALDAGLTDLGENRVQEARSKRETIRLRIADRGLRIKGPFQSEIRNPKSDMSSAFSPVRWHLIGHLQRNKARDAVELFDAVQSVDSLPLVQTLEAQCAGRGRAAPLEIFIQVNVSGESTKSGCAPEDAAALAKTVMDQPHLRLAGLMTMAPFTDDPETARPVFRQLRQLRDELQTALTNAPTRKPANARTALSLSMGMSQDFEVAIEEGADYVRVGTAIFSPQSTVPSP